MKEIISGYYIVFIRTQNISSFNPEDFWESHDKLTDIYKKEHIEQNINLKGSNGIIYKENDYIGKASSIREASRIIGANFKKTNIPNIYKVYDYVFIKQ